MMLPTTIRSPPSVADYIELSEYQSQTPETFHGGKPVLHYHATGIKAWIPKSQRGTLPFFPADIASEPTAPEGSTLNGSAEEQVEQAVDLFVNSETFTIFCPKAESGLSIPYPSITLHAVKKLGGGEQTYQSVYLQLELSDGGADDETYDTVELTLIPTPSTVSTNTHADDATAAPARSEAASLFEAISECSNLNPDPVDEDGEEDDDDRIVFEGERHQAVDGLPGVYLGASGGGLPPPMPGSSGWITAENVHEYFDEEGNWIGEEEEGEGVSGELGEGAGRVRGREEAEEDRDGLNGHGEGDDAESKRPRME